MAMATGRRTALLTSLAMLAFAGNSLLCRLALKHTAIDPASFTAIRIGAGAFALVLIVAARTRRLATAGSWASAVALVVYAAAFSYSYVTLTAATGALLLFGAVQATMIGWSRWRGERLGGQRALGCAMALAGLVGLVLPGLQAPPLRGCLLMLAAGIAWGIYSLRGKGDGNPLQSTAGNFLRASVPAFAIVLFAWPAAALDRAGVLCAVASGAIASGVGYAIWYRALRGLPTASAAAVQLSVPLLAALGGIAWLGEVPTWRLAMAAAAILGGIALVVVRRRA